MNENINRNSFLRTSREFPDEPKHLALELNRTYIDIARNVNTRMIGLFPTTRSVAIGSNWYVDSTNPQPGVRQVYTWNDANLVINHGLNSQDISRFTQIYGAFTDGTVWYPLPYVDVTGITNQISVNVTATQIVISKGAGAPPAVTDGIVVLEWITNATTR